MVFIKLSIIKITEQAVKPMDVTKIMNIIKSVLKENISRHVLQLILRQFSVLTNGVSSNINIYSCASVVNHFIGI